MKKVLFFVNPNAGRADVRDAVVDIAQRFTQEGFDVVLHPTSAAREITDVIAQRGEEFDLILSSGGDGTLNETVTGLMRLEKRPVLGYLPAGTVNDVASTLGLSKNPKKAAEDVLGGKAVFCDVGSFNGKNFLYVAAFGAFSAVSYSTPQAEKRVWGRLAYLANGARSLSDIKPIHCRFLVNGVRLEDDLIYGMVCSTKSVGGFQTGKATGMEVSLSDGLYEIVLVKHTRNLAELNRLGAALLRRDFQDPLFYCFQSDKFRIEFDTPVPWTLDGEFGGDVAEADIVNHKRAIRIMVPAQSDPPAKPVELSP